jgi:MFS family permease
MTTRLYRAVTVVGAAQIISHAGAYYLPAVMATQASQELSISSATVFAGLSLALAVSAITGPTAGKLVDRFGGRPVLLVSNLLLALGLSLLALSQSLGTLLVAYAVLGLGMAAGMFEVAFAAIVHLFGKNSRNALTGVTLVAGFASVAGWTLSVFVEARYGWRGACWFWAAMNVFVAMPLNALLPSAAAASGAKPDSTTQGSAHTKLEPKSPLQQTGHSQVSATQTPMPHASVPATTAEQSPPPAHYAAALLAFVFAASGFISMGMMSHLPKLLEGFGVPLAVAF